MVKRVYEFAEIAHSGQKRLSGDEYICHSLEVASILVDWKMDTVSIVAGLLHDTIDDGAAKQEDVLKEFGEKIAQIVDGVSRVGEIRLRGLHEEEFVENLRKMFFAMAKDLRVVVIKLADRLHNMETLEYLPIEKQIKISKETIEVYAPLAERLGMGKVKGQLEDLSFPYLYPEDYKWLVKYTKDAYKKTETYIKQAKREILDSLTKEKIDADIDGRTKHKYSLYKKLLRPEVGRNLEKVHDLMALRILVNTVEECYMALGVIHKIYHPVPSIGISDFIAMPKPNGYRSIHTKVFGPNGRIVEIQIRTYEMHEQAEYGVASHFHYAAAKAKGASDEVLESGQVFASEEKLGWVKQLANWQKEITDSKEFLQSLKFDALSQRIFVFTPNGDVKDLPNGATPIDFAYAVHTHLGDRTIGAKVNGKITSFDSKLKSGDVCEIMLSKEPRKPSTGWLDFVVTHLAKREINKGLRRN